MALGQIAVGALYDRMVIVSKGGVGYASVKEAVDSITNAVEADERTVLVFPGRYDEDPFTIPSFVRVMAATEAELRANDGANPFITMSANTSLSGFELRGPSADVCVVGAGSSTVKECDFPSGQTGVLLEVAGTMAVEDCTFGAVGTCVSCDTAGTVYVTNGVATGSTTAVLEAGAGGTVVATGLRTRSCADVLLVNGGTMFATNFEDTTSAKGIHATIAGGTLTVSNMVQNGTVVSLDQDDASSTINVLDSSFDAATATIADPATVTVKTATSTAGNLLSGALFTAANGVALNAKVATATVNAAVGATATAAGLIPATAFVLGISTKVTVALGASTGTTGYAVGDGVDPNRWGDIVGVATTTTSDNTDATADPTGFFLTANDVVLTAAGGNFDGAGTIRVSVVYLDLTALSS